MDIKQSISSIQNAINRIESELLISEFSLNEYRENELLFFFKPECFLINNSDLIEALLNMVFNKFKDYNVEISKILLLDGKQLEKLSIMDQHYGLINKLSKNASKILPDKELLIIQQSLDIPSLENYSILGGHEFLKEFNEFNEKSLKMFWFTKKPLKLRSGFYYQKYNIHDENLILINGFHPDQLDHFTNHAHKIVILVIHSNTDWKTLKNDLVGNTFPEKADKNSIRGELFCKSDKYGINNVSVSSNCVHLSAGPFEALFEINNFFKKLKIVEYDLDMTNMVRLMKMNKISEEKIKDCLLNPVTQINNIQIDLFTFTEDKNSLCAVSDYRKYFSNE